MRRFTVIPVLAAMASSFALALPATTAVASCPEVGNVYYSFSNVSKTSKATNLKSDYLKGPGTISYSKNKTGTVSATITGTTSAEAGVIFAKASVSIGVSVGKTWSRGDTWTYTKSVPKGKTARLVMYHETRSMTVKKTRIQGPCKVVTVWTKRVKAPRKANLNVWKLDYA